MSYQPAKGPCKDLLLSLWSTSAAWGVDVCGKIKSIAKKR